MILDDKDTYFRRQYLLSLQLKQVNGGFTSGKIKPNVVEEIKKRQMIDTSGEIKQEPERSILSRNNSTCIKNMEGE